MAKVFFFVLFVFSARAVPLRNAVRGCLLPSQQLLAECFSRGGLSPLLTSKEDILREKIAGAVARDVLRTWVKHVYCCENSCTYNHDGKTIDPQVLCQKMGTCLCACYNKIMLAKNQQQAGACLQEVYEFFKQENIVLREREGH